MRFIIPAIAVALIASLSTPSFAAKKSTQAYAKSYNSCVSLAKQRGFARSDIYDQRSSAAAFVRRCMQGRQK